MVSTHAWKATISSPLPSTTNTATQQQQSSSSSSSSGSNIGNTGGMGFGSSASKGIGGSSSTSSTTSSTFIGSNYNHKPSAPTAMGGVATHDFESLLSNSTSLLTSMGRNNGGGGGISGMGNASGIIGGGMMSASGGIPAFGSTAQQSSSTSTSSSSSMALGDKSLLELNVASRTPSFPTADGNGPNGIRAAAASGTGTTAATYEAEASAHRLFAREGWGFDSARLGRRARELERRANVGGASSSDDVGGTTRTEEEKKEGGFDRYGEGGPPGGGGSNGGGGGMERHPLADLSGASLRHVLSSHHEYCVRTALRQAREWTVDQAESRTEEKIEGDWEEERRRILGRGVLGHRFLAGSGGGRVGGGAMGAKGGVASRVPLLEGDAGGAGGAASGTSSSPYGDIAPSSQPLPGGAEGLVESHLASIDKHLTAVSAPSSRTSADAATLLASLQEGAEDAVVAAADSGTNPERARGYSNALSLLRSIAHCRATLETSAGTGSDSDVDSDVAAGAAGACDFFARQFASHVGAAVRDAELAGMRSRAGYAGRNAAARDVCAFATLAAGGDVAEGRGGVWLKLFYCLRCGDLVAANSILQQFGTAASEDTSHVDQSVSNIVSQLAQLQQTRETIFGDGTHGNARPARPPASSLLHPTQPMLHARRTVSDLYRRTNTRSSHSGGSPAEEPFHHYRTACLAMLGGAESISEAPALASSGLVKTVEDYLYATLWHAICLADGGPVGGMGSAGGGGLRKVSSAVARLGVLVDRWGPSHFERDDARAGVGASDAVAHAARGGTLGGHGEGPSPSGGWAYALPLLASQRYATALAYVAEAGGGLGLLQAAHLGVVMDVAGLSIGDFSLEGGADAGRAESQRRLLPVLVASYSASLQGVDAGAALKYLVLLSDKGKFVKEQVQRLLLETHQFTTLAGTIQPDGSRSLAALDAYFSKKRVSALLVDAAHHAMRAGKPADAAELLVLSGRFGALFELMNRELASYLNAATPEDFEKRQFWFRAASQFHAIHLATGRTYVQTALDDDGNLSLGNTFQLLMNLVVFFDRCREQQWEGAWVLMDNLQLLPKTESEMTVRLEAFRALDNCVRRVFHHVVLSAMEALCHLFRTTKQSGGGAVAGGAASNINLNQQNAIDQRLDEFRTRARLLVTFARLLNLPSLGDGDTYVRISQLEKNMM